MTVLLAVAGCSSIENYPPITGAYGEVSRSIGLPSVTRNAQPYILDEQSRIFVGDLITTDQRSLVEISIAPGQVITLSPDSQLLVIEAVSDGETYATDTSLTRGSMQVNGNDASTHRITVRTSIARVRTYARNFWVGYGTSHDPELLVISLSSDPVTVNNSDGELTLQGVLQTTSVTPGSAPQDPTDWSKERVENTIEYYNNIP